jgi:mono/diheme cytochrome c family protein
MEFSNCVNMINARWIFLLVLLFDGGIMLARKKPPKPEELGAELGKAPAKVDSWKNPYAGQGDAFSAGGKLFNRHCAECHGADGRGREKAPDLHSPIIQMTSPGRLFWFLKNGNLKEGMPSWSKLPDQQRWQLVTYLQSLQRTPSQPPKDSDMHPR